MISWWSNHSFIIDLVDEMLLPNLLECLTLTTQLV